MRRTVTLALPVGVPEDMDLEALASLAATLNDLLHNALSTPGVLEEFPGVDVGAVDLADD